MLCFYTQRSRGRQWVECYRGQRPLFVCVLGFTETGLIPAISAAGKTPQDRRYTAIADAEFLLQGCQPTPHYPLPPLTEGASPVFISRAVLANQAIPIHVFNAGLPQPPAIPHVRLAGQPAQCVSTGQALPTTTVTALLQQGLDWGMQFAAQAPQRYLILSECVVGGTTTALAILSGLGIAAMGKVNSSHRVCNHQLKAELVRTGLATIPQSPPLDPVTLVAAVGDPMQIVVAGMAMAASRQCGVLLAGGTQMLAIYALCQSLAERRAIPWGPDRIVVGTTRWVVEDPTGDTVGLAREIPQVPLLASQLSFADSRYPQLQAYEQGYVKEGVGAGGCAIAAHLYQGWQQTELLTAIESLVAAYQEIQ